MSGCKNNVFSDYKEKEVFVCYALNIRNDVSRIVCIEIVLFIFNIVYEY